MGHPLRGVQLLRFSSLLFIEDKREGTHARSCKPRGSVLLTSRPLALTRRRSATRQMAVTQASQVEDCSKRLSELEGRLDTRSKDIASTETRLAGLYWIAHHALQLSPLQIVCECA